MKITVKVRKDRGDLGVHPRYGALIPGAVLTIEEEEFGDQLFERAAEPKAKEVTDHA